jgi:flagellar motor protein MotB
MLHRLYYSLKRYTLGLTPQDWDCWYQHDVPTAVYWQSGTASYSSDFVYFNQQADFLRCHPELVLLIAGHTDSTEGSRELCLKLGESRAGAHRDILHYQCGIALNRMELISYGRERPVVWPEHDDQDRRLNRRTDTRISSIGR